MSPVLDGIRVLDFSRYIAAPTACALLADAGAEVVRVEAPGGEEDRRIGVMGPQDQPMWFACTGRHKRGITLDLRNEAASPLLRDLVRLADVIVHNYAPGSPQAALLHYDALAEINPSIIVAAISAYGQTGPFAEKTGFDVTVQATAGMMDLTGQADGPPTRSGVAIGDFLAGYNGAFGVMLALWERNASGLGQMVDVGLFDSTVLPVIAQAMVSEVRHTGRARRRIGNGSWYSFVDSFEALDGTVMICPAIESQWRRLARTIGRADLLDDERYRDNLSRFEHRDEISPIVQAWVEQRTVEEVSAAMDAARVPCSRVLTVPEMAQHPQVHAREMLVEVGREGEDTMTVAGFPIKLSRTPATVEGAPPHVGEHNRWAYEELLGLDTAALSAQGLI